MKLTKNEIEMGQDIYVTSEELLKLTDSDIIQIAKNTYAENELRKQSKSIAENNSLYSAARLAVGHMSPFESEDNFNDNYSYNYNSIAAKYQPSDDEIHAIKKSILFTLDMDGYDNPNVSFSK